MSVAASSLAAEAEASWPARPDASVLSRSIPLFFISPDNDGFWIAREADFRVGGVFLFQRSALRFAQRCSAPNRCATMVLEEPHNLDIENRGNRLVARLRPVRRLFNRLAMKIRTLSPWFSRAYIEHRMLRAALEAELYREQYKHSNKNDDDLPIVTDLRMRRDSNTKRANAGGGKSVLPVIIAFSLFALGVAAIIVSRAAIWLPRFHQ